MLVLRNRRKLKIEGKLVSRESQNFEVWPSSPIREFAVGGNLSARYWTLTKSHRSRRCQHQQVNAAG